MSRECAWRLLTKRCPGHSRDSPGHFLDTPETRALLPQGHPASDTASDTPFSGTPSGTLPGHFRPKSSRGPRDSCKGQVGRGVQRGPNPPEIQFAEPRLIWVKGRSSPARGYRFGCVCVFSYMAGVISHHVHVMTGHIGTNTPKFVPPFDPTQTGLCKFGWVWSSLRVAKLDMQPFRNARHFLKVSLKRCLGGGAQRRTSHQFAQRSSASATSCPSASRRSAQSLLASRATA